MTSHPLHNNHLAILGSLLFDFGSFTNIGRPTVAQITIMY